MPNIKLVSADEMAISANSSELGLGFTAQSPKIATRFGKHIKNTEETKVQESVDFNQLITTLEKQLQDRPTADNLDVLMKEMEGLKQEHQSYINELTNKHI
jgi:methylthioribose-1-phosphate isomerase